MINYIHTDLACETNIPYRDYFASQTNIVEQHNDKDSTFSSNTINGFTIRRMKTKTSDNKTENYSTIYFDNCSRLYDKEQRLLSLLIANEIQHICNRSFNEFLICGLGNKNMTPDSIGPKVIEKVLVSRHISKYDKQAFQTLNTKPVSAIAAGVLSQTGIESADIIKALCEKISPDVIITIDSLCARSNERLCKTIQITDTGVSPGSGVNNKRPSINSSLLGVPVISIGFPMVINCATMIYDLFACDGRDIENDIKQLLENNVSYFITLNEIDEISNFMSDIISNAIDTLTSLDPLPTIPFES